MRWKFKNLGGPGDTPSPRSLLTVEGKTGNPPAPLEIFIRHNKYK